MSDTNDSKVNLGSFELDFFSVKLESADDFDDLDYDRDEALDVMQEVIPDAAVSLGSVDEEVDHMATTWKVEEYFYAIPWKGDDFKWALFRITWDNNWEFYDWASCARTAEGENLAAAGNIMMKALLEDWGYLDNSAFAHLWDEF